MRQHGTDSPPCIRLPTGKETVSLDDDEELVDDDLYRVPRSGKRTLMPIEKLRPR